MPRSRLEIPAYRKHRSTGRAVVSVYRADGSRKEILLPGKYGSEESKQEYARILAQLNVGKGNMPAAKPNTDLTVSELVLRFMQHAETYYVDPAGKPTSEIAALTAAFRPLVRLYAGTPAAEFGPLALQTLRRAMVSGSWLSNVERDRRIKANRPIGMARSTCNKNVNRIKLLFKWAASMELIPASVSHGLVTVAGLRRGRSGARETKPVTPISPAVIYDTLPHLPPVVRDMVEILLLSGMRCGELCIMRARDLDVTGDIWLYRPGHHKGLWRGKERVIAIGPRAQEIVKKYFLTAKIDAYLFTPVAQDEVIRTDKRAKRKTPLYPSHTQRLAMKKKSNARRRPGARFEVGAINRAIRRACKRMEIEPWHVHQLRHSASLAFSRELGLESARAALGHSTVDISAMYAGHDLQRAKEVAAKLGWSPFISGNVAGSAHQAKVSRRRRRNKLRIGREIGPII